MNRHVFLVADLIVSLVVAVVAHFDPKPDTAAQPEASIDEVAVTVTGAGTEAGAEPQAAADAANATAVDSQPDADQIKTIDDELLNYEFSPVAQPAR